MNLGEDQTLGFYLPGIFWKLPQKRRVLCEAFITLLYFWDFALAGFSANVTLAETSVTRKLFPFSVFS